MFLPWAASGDVSRSGWELATTAARLEITDGGWGRIALGAFLLVPAGAFATFVAVVSGRRWLMAATSVPTILMSAWGATVVAASPLDTRWGLLLNCSAAGADVMLILLLPAAGGLRDRVERQG